MELDVDEAQKKEVKELFINYDRSLLVMDPRRAEPKKFGGKGARSKIQKSYRWALYVLLLLCKSFCYKQS